MSFVEGGAFVGFEWNDANLGARLRAIPAEFYAETRVLLTTAGRTMLQEATWQAAQFSTRIPRSIFLRVQMGAKANVSVRASLKVAPHARVMEGFTRDPFRHPVFGGETWVEQGAHPYLEPTAQRYGRQFRDDVNVILQDVYRRAGLVE